MVAVQTIVPRSAARTGPVRNQGSRCRAGAAALAPVAVKTAGELARGLGVESPEDLVKSPGEALGGATSKVGDRITSSVTDKATDPVDEAGGPTAS